MVRWLGRLMKLLRPDGERSSGLTDLTEWEHAFLERTGRCPDCGTGDLLWGPTGGVSVNVMCSRCGTKFNIGLGQHPDRKVWFAQRIGYKTGGS
jgi:ribosomal protein S27AE